MQTGNNMFSFQQFDIHDELCGMKVGTDAVLLGAWCDVTNCKKVLDVGCGSGIISLMVAQRNPEAFVTGIDIDHDAVRQARMNFNTSPWGNRLNVQYMDFCDNQSELTPSNYDLIVCNPPFFTEDTNAPDKKRDIARRANSLPLELLITNAGKLLHPEGRLAVILPYTQTSDCILSAACQHLYLKRKCVVKGSVRKPAKRIMLEFTHYSSPTEHQEIVIGDSLFNTLTKDFYLPKN